MKALDFDIILNKQIERCVELLGSKGKEYADNVDRLIAFKEGAGLTGENPKEVLAGMMLKHTVSVYDMCRSDKEYSYDKWDEKITDHINYLILLKAIVIEEQTEEKTNG